MISKRINKNFFDFSYILISKILILVIGIVNGFILPKVLGINKYGEYKTFLLYLSFASLFQFGISEYVFSKYGGYSYNEVDKEQIKKSTSILLYSQLLIVSLFLIVGLIFYYDQKQILIFIAVNIYLSNINYFYSRFSQSIKEFKSFSIITMFERLLFILPVMLNLKYDLPLLTYYTLFTLKNIIVNLTYIYRYKETFYMGSICVKTLKKIYYEGLPLFISNFITILIFGSDKIFIRNFLEIESFSYYSFAYSMVVTINIIIDSVYLFVYPHLKRLSINNLKNLYSKFNSFSFIIAGYSMSCVFIMEYIVLSYINEYVNSLTYLRLLFPILIFKINISIVKKIYFISLNKQNNLKNYNVFILIISIILNLIFILLKREASMIIFASLISFILWYFLLEFKINRINFKSNPKDYIYIIIVIVTYTIIVNIKYNLILSFLLYLTLITILTSCIYLNEIKSIIKSLNNKIQGRKK